MNHYIHAGVQTLGQYLERMRAYSLQEVEFDCKLNVPSLGVYNEAENEKLGDLINKYVDMSPIPIFHY